MPFVSVDHFAGLDDTVRRRLQVRLAEVVMEAYQVPPGSVRVYTRAFDPADVYMANGETESGLPIIRVEYVSGRSLDQKRALVHGLAHAAAELLQIPVSRIRTILMEQETQNWARGDQLVADAK
ncbi:MAG: tautomerase family protein [Bacillota bacterium]